MPKRCGHLDGKSVVPTREFQAKLKAAVSAKRDGGFLIVARTDARGVEGLNAAIERAKAYDDVGADAIFPEGLESEEEFEKFRGAVELPLLANMTEFGKTPLITVSRFKELGYQMVIFPMSAFRLALRAMDEGYAEILELGTQAGLIDKMRSRVELYDRIDYPGYDRLDRNWSEIP